MTTLPNMAIDLPVLGGDSGTWDDKINAGFGLVDAHDHSSGKGVTVKSAGISINADLPFGGWGATTLGKTAFSAVAPLASGTKTLFVSNVDNELYWRTNAGANVKLTAGASINTSLVGGIVGDYASVGAAVAYDDANKRYTFKTQTATWARLATGPVRIYEYNTTDSVYVEHAVAAALAASYTVTWPAALPASKAKISISAAGVVTFDLTTTDEVVISSALAAVQAPPTATTPGHGFGTGWQIGIGDNEPIDYPVTFPVGTVITSWSLAAYKASNVTDTLRAELYYRTGVGPGAAETLVGVQQNNATNNPGVIALTHSPSHTMVTARVYFVRCVSINAVAGADVFGDLTVTVNRPA